MNYEKEYDEYWSRPDRWQSHSFSNPAGLARQIETLCGRGSLLDVGCGMGLLVRTLAAGGIDAHGVDAAARPVEESRRLLPGRFHQGSILSLPFAGNSFDTVTTTDCLEHIAEADVPAALKELHRVARRFTFVQLATKPDRDGRWHLTVHDRSWWERQFFLAGFRKHPLGQLAVPYEALEQEGWQITLVFEKIPAAALTAYPLAALQAERDLHMDMLREPGRRSDAHVVRYLLARDYLPAEGLVLDAACGLGYGSALLAQSSASVRVVGIDNSAYAARYGELNFCPNLPNLSFQTGDVCDLSKFADASVGLVVSFETVEHLREPHIFLKEVRRVLQPGGKFICSVPNMWVDETGQDPNPWHFHVFDFPKLAALCGEFFDVGDVYRQTAGGGMKLTDAPRQLRKMNLPVTTGADAAEWWLLVAGKEISVDADLLRRVGSRSVAVMTTHPNHSVYRSWTAHCPFPVTIIDPASAEVPTNALLLVTHDTYTEPGRSLIRKTVAAGIPTLILADGVLEYRNTWEHPQIEPGAIFQPVLGHKIATIGRSQSRWLESWGNSGKCETVGLPRLDRHCSWTRRQRSADAPFRILINTAITPYFTEAQRLQVTASLRDLKTFFDQTPASHGLRLEPVWRLTKGLDQEIGVSSQVSDLSGSEMAVVLQNVDAVITTPSTVILEAALFGLPVAALDYCNVPAYVPTAWRITAEAQMASVIGELVQPAEAKLLFQETALHDSLECATPAKPRLLRLICEMVAHGLRCAEEKRPLNFPDAILHPHGLTAVTENRFRKERLYDPVPTASQAAPAPTPKPKPLDAQQLRDLAEASVREGRHADAVEFYSQLLQLNQRDTDALLGQAAASAKQGHLVLASILLSELTDLDPAHAGALALRAELNAGKIPSPAAASRPSVSELQLR